EPAAAQVEQTESKFTIRAAAEPTGNQPLTAMQLVIDGRPVGPVRRVKPPAAGDMAAKVEADWTVDLPPGKYSVAVKAETDHNIALSPPVEVTRPAAEGTPRPKLYVLSVGTTPEANAAGSIAKAMSAAAPGVFGEVVARTLEGEQATPAGINAVLEAIQKQA